MITYRPIEEKDNKTLALLIRNVFEEFGAHLHRGTIYTDPTTDNLFDLFRKEDSICWVVKKNDTIIGCCGIYPTRGLPDGCAELVKFYLAKDQRGRGIGKKILNLSIDSAKDFGYSSLYLESLPEFSNAVAMYERYGFKPLSKPLGDSGHFGCNIWMVKQL
ncbi:GNAT family N-acetyltransferase [Flagellimonas meishanensis]|uniref:GNAT family N-acetyltransferase n=1 Tax=Flagellimonas meishanensis TaxID=2873264 RepID=UPI001CA77DB9|nr:GNAT family N-acetyltransferase [[Muricauda] meishanensis]